MKVPKRKALELIDEKISQFQTILAKATYDNRYGDDYEIAYHGAESLLTEVFSEPEAEKFRINVTSPVIGVIGGRVNYAKELERYKRHISKCIAQLKSSRERVSNFWEDDDAEPGNEGAVSLDGISRAIHVCERFYLVARQLEKRHNDRAPLRMEDEYDVQDLLHALLRIDFDDVRPEEWTPSYAGSSSKMDFLLKEQRIVVETKKTRQRLSDKQIGDQLLVDIAKYKQHQDCRTLICFIYDPEQRIQNPRGLERDLNKLSDGRMRVIAVVEPS
jgi:hypothetical protein